MTRGDMTGEGIVVEEPDGLDGGRAMLEFIFLGVLTLVPLLYLVLAAFDLERNVFAVTEAAREAGRAYSTAADPGAAQARASYAAGLALQDQGVSAAGMQVSYVPVAATCAGGGGGAESLAPSADFAVCVTRTFQLPGIPGYLAGRSNTVTGRYVVHVDDFRAAGR